MTEINDAEELYARALPLIRKSPVEAIRLLEHAFNVVQKDWRLSWDLGWCYFRLERLDDARKHFLRAAKLAPKNATCKWALGNVYLKKKQYKKAETVLSEALKIKESHLTRIALALAYLAHGKVTDAENTHLEGIRLKPKKSAVYESYAAFLSDVGREGEATRMNRKARQLRKIN
jgi:Flp pilus assembly protein TadD